MNSEQNHSSKPGRKKRILKRTVCVVVVLGMLSLIPLPIRPVDRDRAVDQSINALLRNERVFLDWGYIPFYDYQHFNFGSTNLYYQNDAGISASVFDKHNIPEVVDSSQLNLGPDALIEVTYFNSYEEEVTRDLHFAFIHGPLAAQCYKMRLYRNIWGVFVFYRIVWVS